MAVTTILSKLFFWACHLILKVFLCLIHTPIYFQQRTYLLKSVSKTLQSFYLFTSVEAR